MAQRRMFSLKVVDTDSFWDMPVSARELYFQFGMRADDDGFLGNPRRIMRMAGASDDDFRVLVARKFVIPMSTNGVCVITHWKTNNLIRPDRYEETQFKEEKERLTVFEGKYKIDFSGIPNVIPKDIPDDIPRLGKGRLGNNILPVIADAKQETKSSTEKKPRPTKCPNTTEGHKGCIEFIDSLAESRGVKFANYGKQIMGLHNMLRAAYTFEAINTQIDFMEADRFWSAKGFDLMTVANEIGKGGGTSGFKR